MATSEALRVRAAALIDQNTRFGRAFDNLLLALIVLSVASVVLDATPTPRLNPTTSR